MKQLIEQITEKIRTNHFNEVIELMLPLLEDHRNELRELQGRFHQIEKEDLGGRISKEEAGREYNKIRHALLVLKDSIDEDSNSNTYIAFPVQFKLVEYENLDYSHCLRKETTKSIIRLMTYEHSFIRLIGTEGMGRTRLIEDIYRCLLGCRVVKVSIKANINSYHIFLKSVANQLGVSFTSNTSLMDMLVKSSELTYLLIDDFDAFMHVSEKDSRYEKDFISELNSLRNTRFVRSLCITKNQDRFHQDDFTSPIDGIAKILPPLKEKDIEHEIKKYIRDYLGVHWILNEPKKVKLIASKVERRQNRAQYGLLCFLLEHVIYMDRTDYVYLERKISKLIKRYDKQHGYSHSITSFTINFLKILSKFLKKP